MVELVRLDRPAGFAVADLAATGLGTGAADAVLCVDAIQFAPEPEAAYRELRRVEEVLDARLKHLEER